MAHRVTQNCHSITGPAIQFPPPSRFAYDTSLSLSSRRKLYFHPSAWKEAVASQLIFWSRVHAGTAPCGFCGYSDRWSWRIQPSISNLENSGGKKSFQRDFSFSTQLYKTSASTVLSSLLRANPVIVFQCKIQAYNSLPLHPHDDGDRLIH